MNPTTQISPIDLQSFQKANPGLQFTNEDLQHYNAAVPTTLDGSQINTNPQAFAVPQVNPQSVDQQLSSQVQALAGQQAKLQAADTTAENNVNNSNNTLNDLMAQLGGQTVDKSNAEVQAGIPTMQKDLADLGALQTQQLGGYINQLNKNQLNADGKFGTAVSDNEAQIQRQHGIDALITSSLIQAKQGNITAAQNTVDRAIAAKYDPIKTRIEVQQAIIKQNYDSLSRVDKKLADAQNQKLEFQKMQLQQAQNNDKELHDVMLTASKYNAPQSVLSSLQRIISSGDPNAYLKAVSLASPYLTDPIERSYKLAQTQKLLKEAKDAGVGDPAQTIAYAQQYASTGTIPTGLPKSIFGAVAQYAKELPKPTGTLVDRNTGVKSGALSSTQEDGVIALKDLTSKLQELKSMPKIGAPGTVTSYEGLRSEIIDLLARARTGAAISANEEALYKGKIPSASLLNVNPGKRIDALVDSLTGKLDTTLRTQGLSIYGYSKVKLGGQEYTVGDVIDNGNGQYGRVNPDGTITLTSAQ